MRIELLDHGYVELIESWGSDERVIEAARMSTGKGFLGWGERHDHLCPVTQPEYPGSPFGGKCNCEPKPGDEKLLRFLYEHKHATPFEMAGLVIEVQAPIFVFREWHRHRTQCLAPDTLIHFDAPKSRDNRRSVYKMRIEDIWRKFQPTQRRSRSDRQINPFFPRSRIQAMQLRCLDEEQSEIVHTKIIDVIRGEPKLMVRVRTASGRELTATREHRVLTSVGWMTLGEAISSGALLTLEGTTRSKAMRWEVAIDLDQEEWKPIVGWEGIYEVSNQGRVRRVGHAPRKISVGANGYDVVSLNRPGEQVVRTVHTLVLEAFRGYRPIGFEARHLNSNRADARLKNLEWVPATINAKDRIDQDRQQRLVSVFEEIVEVVDVGMLPTFDLSVEGPWHNFIADGFVVHNSYNEMSSRYTPLPDVNYVPSIERLMMGGDGKNKQAGTIKDADILTQERAQQFRQDLFDAYSESQIMYEDALRWGVPKELARIHLPVGRYSRMRASANLRNWLGFLTLRMAPDAQWEIRVYANAVGEFIAKKFPRTWELFVEAR
jgi:thymidylate synthase ThyX